jgi:hypothetical protein
MRTKDREVFLELLRRGHNEASACKHINYDLGQLGRKKRTDPQFRTQVKQAIDEANHRLLQVLGQDRARRVLARLDRQARQRQVIRERELAQAQRRTAQTVAACNAMETAVANGSLPVQAIAARVMANLLTNGTSATSNGRGRRKRV